MNSIRNRYVFFLLILSYFLVSTALANEATQPARPDDMKIFEPYIGAFRSESRLFDESDIAYHYVVSYQWYDKGHTIVKYEVTMEIPVQGRTLPMSEGFYGYDPFNGNLYVFGAFTRGITGWGTVGKFDLESGSRETWARSMSPEGVVTHVRDTFEHIDADHWINRTYLRMGQDTEWKLAVEDNYSRVE